MRIGICRPPSTSVIDFFVELSSLLTNLNNTNVTDNLIIASDFNIDLPSNKCPNSLNCCYLMLLILLCFILLVLQKIKTH